MYKYLLCQFKKINPVISASVSMEVASQPRTVFQEKQGKRTIDVYWLSDDGGLSVVSRKQPAHEALVKQWAPSSDCRWLPQVWLCCCPTCWLGGSAGPDAKSVCLSEEMQTRRKSRKRSEWPASWPFYYFIFTTWLLIWLIRVDFSLKKNLPL